MMRETKKTANYRQVIVRDWDNFTEFLDSVSAPDCPTSNRASHRSGGDYGGEFHGAPSFPEALKLARDGWPEGRKGIEELRDVLYNRVITKVARPECQFDVTGEVGIDMGEFMTGNPECMLDTRDSEDVYDAPIGNRVLTLVFNCTTSCVITRQVIEAKGAAVAALVDLLESTGRRVEVICGFSVDGGYGSTAGHGEWHVTVKHAEEPLQLDQLAFALAHPDMQRRMLFSACEYTGSSAWRQAMGFHALGGYGTPVEFSELKGDINVGCSRYGSIVWESPKAAIEWIEKQLREQGVELVD